MSARLSVNLNKVALLRNARAGEVPGVVDAARIVIAAGAPGVTVHPRPDQRHIRPADVLALSALVADQPDVELNIEGNPWEGAGPHGYPGFDALIDQARPAQATLVPDASDQLTSDHGWQLDDPALITRLTETVGRYQALGARVSLFMDADAQLMSRARDTGAERIELYTGPFAAAVLDHGLHSPEADAALAACAAAAAEAQRLGLAVNAGHDLDQQNLVRFRSIADVAEVSIGHALTAEALLGPGLRATVEAYLKILAGEP